MNALFLSDHATGLWQAAGPRTPSSFCADLARCNAPKLGMPMIDSLHVACALEIKAERFWTLDEREAKLARAE